MAKGSDEFTFTNSLLGLIRDVLSQQQVKVVFEKIANRMSQYITFRDKNSVDAFQQLIDFETDFQKQANPKLAQQISCRKGCSFCCEQSVRITQDEARKLARVVRERGLEIDSARLEDQAQWSSTQWLKHTRQNRRCVFLDKDSACRIYAERPMSCRKLLSLDEPTKCDPRNSMVPEMFVAPESEIIASAAFNCSPTGSLAKLLKEELDKLPVVEPSDSPTV